jgi:ferrous iron transport protein B
MPLFLSDLNIGDKGFIHSVKATGEIRRRLLDVGLFKGTKFKIMRLAPLGDPIVIRVKGFDLSLRLEEAKQIRVEKIGFTGDGIPMREHKNLYSPIPKKEKIIRNTKKITVALLGNPNSGKTSLFNAIVGAHQKVGNFTGVTVEKTEGSVKHKDYIINIIDLPGTYSLTPFSPEEVVARDYIIEEKPDVVIDVIAGSNLERNLYLTTQVMELEVDMLVALNMWDEVEKQGIEVDIPQLEALLGSHVIPTSASKKQGIDSLLDHIISVFEGEITISKNKMIFSREIEERIIQISNILENDDLSEKYNSNWLATKLLENDQLVYETVKKRSVYLKIVKMILDFNEKYKKHHTGDPESAIIEDRHSFIRGALKETVKIPDNPKKTITDHVDNILLNRVLGLPIFFAIMWGMFQFTFTLGEVPMGWLDSFFQLISNGLTNILPEGLFQSLLVDGIIAGVGGVLIFLPNILLLFLFISLLEGTGYMARAAFVIDRVMHKVGLHGKSFIPMITGFGCSVPAIMATRTLKNRGDRIVTMLIIPFMSCGAKLPVYILLLSAFFAPASAGNILFGIYLFGILLAFISAFILKKAAFPGQSEPFVMELPPYRLPGYKSLLYQMIFKVKMYLKKAGTIILVASVIIWLASNFPVSSKIEKQYYDQISITTNPDTIEELQNMATAEQLEYSVAGRFGKIIEPVIRPLGFDWKIGIALTAGIAAKEIVVSTMSTIFALGEENEESPKLATRLREESGYSRATALSLMVFVLLYLPCFAATAMFHKEAGAWKWTRLFIIYTMSVAWVMSFIAYRLGLIFL